MRISIVIPTLNNINYLKIVLESIKKNSNYEHEIIVHVNENKDNTLDYLKSSNIKHTFSEENLGLCSSVNKASKLVIDKLIDILKCGSASGVIMALIYLIVIIGN